MRRLASFPGPHGLGMRLLPGLPHFAVLPATKHCGKEAIFFIHTPQCSSSQVISQNPQAFIDLLNSAQPGPSGQAAGPGGSGAAGQGPPPQGGVPFGMPTTIEVTPQEKEAIERVGVECKLILSYPHTTSTHHHIHTPSHVHSTRSSYPHTVTATPPHNHCYTPTQSLLHPTYQCTITSTHHHMCTAKKHHTHTQSHVHTNAPSYPHNHTCTPSHVHNHTLPTHTIM